MKRSLPKIRAENGSRAGSLVADIRAAEADQLVYLYGHREDFVLVQRLERSIRLIVDSSVVVVDHERLMSLDGWEWPDSHLLTDDEATVTLAKLALGADPKELFKEALCLADPVT